MDLILWRHADAEDRIPDAERRLTERGVKQARKIAGWLAGRLPDDALVLVSPAVRATQTAQELRRSFQIEPAVGVEAQPEDLLAAARWPKGRRTVLIVGHQPTLGAAAALAMTGSPRPWGFRKGALWWIEARGRDHEAVLRAVIAPEHL